MPSWRRIAAALAVAAAALASPLAAPAAAQTEDADARQVVELIDGATRKLQNKDYDGAIADYRRALGTVEDRGFPEAAKRQVEQLAWYNLACAYSLKGAKGEALDAFEKSLAAGFADFDHIAGDSDLDPIRKEPRFEDIVRRFRSGGKAPAEPPEPAASLAGELSKDALFPFEFELKALDGKPVRLADLKGKVVLVDLWGTWCPPCRMEVPHLIALSKEYGPKGFEVVGLNFERADEDDAPELVRKFVAEAGIPYRCALIDREFLEKIPDFEGFPTLLLIDRAGKVRLKHVGYSEKEPLAGAVAALLAEAGPAAPAAPPKREEPEEF